MKQIEEMKHLGYVGNVRQKNKTFDEELYTTYASELTLAEKQNRSKRQVNTSTGKTKETKETGKTNVKTTIWFIGFLATVAFFINSKTGRENIKRVVTDCGRPTPIQFGSTIVNEHEGTKYGSKASVVCSTGFTSSKPETECLANGKWSPVYCHVTDCGKTLPAVKNGHLTINKEQDTTYGAMATVTCAPGYQRNKHTVSCQADGVWEEALCQPVNCGIPEIEHGHLEMDSTVYLSQAYVKCDPGYAPRQPTVTCSASRVWQNAHCYNVDDCLPNPCLNGGECVDKIADFTCQCKQWYSGKTCEINPCANHQCRNGGTCNVLPNGGYSCTCPRGIDGLFCESPHH
ncbi:sushi, nidogen and EGF-like domain-containing protein 1 isoform X2 [Mercenaria mercenaria]|uniref:sushi, nidogen and EGF-like domain-containing protein 1 isoform X2 n=1 Tax=Mercenaria mercenaria TaxID=6596 RepID=UPI00234FA873|nr:sushi, nidogen and EGF-like domain-containing protein 1 isoform X2 [Mercenaria mercenaria]